MVGEGGGYIGLNDSADEIVQKKPYYNNHKELAKLRRGDRVDSPLRALSCAGSPLLVNKLHTPDSEEKKTKSKGIRTQNLEDIQSR